VCEFAAGSLIARRARLIIGVPALPVKDVKQLIAGLETSAGSRTSRAAGPTSSRQHRGRGERSCRDRPIKIEALATGSAAAGSNFRSTPKVMPFRHPIVMSIRKNRAAA
jgi:hypothetical protein